MDEYTNPSGLEDGDPEWYEYHFLEIFEHFKDAKKRSLQISTNIKISVKIKKEGDKFKILVPLIGLHESRKLPRDAPIKPRTEARNKISNNQDDYYEEEDYLPTEEPEDQNEFTETIDDELQREMDDLLKEIHGDTEDWGRSSQTGWFYED